MDFSHYPTPRLDALKKPHNEYGIPDIVYHYKAVPIEQQLEACRAALAVCRKRLVYHAPLDAHIDVIEQTLTATAPTL